jgi:predicted Zn-dependent protease
MEYKARLPEYNVNVTPTSPLKDFFTLAGGVMLILIGIYFALGFAVDFLVPRISPELETRLAAFVPLPEQTSHSEAEEALSTLLDKLQRCSEVEHGVTVLLSESERVNAFALPGRVIVVNKGLAGKAASENELSFVLAHELGHIANRDHLRGIGRGLVFMALSAMLLGPDNSVGRMLGKGLQLSEMKFSRLQESRADSYALHMLNCVYGHVGGATEFFTMLEEEFSTGRVQSFFSTHPMNAQRVNDLEEERVRNGYLIETQVDLPEELQKLAQKTE